MDPQVAVLVYIAAAIISLIVLFAIFRLFSIDKRLFTIDGTLRQIRDELLLQRQERQHR